jgi:hypothetical protein
VAQKPSQFERFVLVVDVKASPFRWWSAADSTAPTLLLQHFLVEVAVLVEKLLVLGGVLASAARLSGLSH